MAHVSTAVDSPFLEVQNLTVTSGKRMVVADLSLSAATGALVWITGENGAGKSSLLRVLAMRGAAAGTVRFSPAARLADITFYAPPMGVPAHTTAADWFAFTKAQAHDAPTLLADSDPLVPDVAGSALLSRLSTGEAKRILLWSLLRLPRPFTFLDEPYEHLSPSAKARLTHILRDRALRGVVVVATNQDVPDGPSMQILNLA